MSLKNNIKLQKIYGNPKYTKLLKNPEIREMVLSVLNE